MFNWLFGKSSTERAQVQEIENLRKERADLSDRLQLVGVTLEEMLEERRLTVDLLLTGSLEDLLRERNRIKEQRAAECAKNKLRKIDRAAISGA